MAGLVNLVNSSFDGQDVAAFIQKTSPTNRLLNNHNLDVMQISGGKVYDFKPRK